MSRPTIIIKVSCLFIFYNVLQIFFTEYVQIMSMGANFDEDTLVTSVRKVSNDRELCTPRRGNTPDYSRTLSLPNEIAEVSTEFLKLFTTLSC